MVGRNRKNSGLLWSVRRFLFRSSRFMLWITRPGSFFHELAHQLACYAVGHQVLEVRYILLDDPEKAGYVRHRGEPGVVKHLFIGIAPLLLGLAIWAAYIGLATYLTRDGTIGLVDASIIIAATLVTANATYHALPSPADMENVFKQPFSPATIPCYMIAGPVWAISHNYRCFVWGWTPWHALVITGTVYELYNVVASNLISILPGLPRLLTWG